MTTIVNHLNVTFGMMYTLALTINLKKKKKTKNMLVIKTTEKPKSHKKKKKKQGGRGTIRKTDTASVRTIGNVGFLNSRGVLGSRPGQKSG